MFFFLQPIRNYLKQNSKFLDSLRIHVKAGTGGFGFPRYGGEGGKGGDVCFVATEGMYYNMNQHNTFIQFPLVNF